MSDGEVRDYRSLGEILREAREAKGWTVEELFEQTKISPRMIRALETDDVDQFDSPVYLRGFVRQLALALDLDPDWVLTKLGVAEKPSVTPPVEPVFPKAPITPPTAPAPAERGPVWEVESVRVRKLTPEAERRVPWRAIGVVIVLVVIAVVVVLSMRGDEPDSRTSQSRPTPPVVAREVPAAGPAAPPEETGAVDVVEASEARSGGTVDDASGDTETSVESTPRIPVDQLEWNPSTAPSAAAETTPEREMVVRDPESVVTGTGTTTPARDGAVQSPAREATPPRPASRRPGSEATPPAPRNEVVGGETRGRGLPSVVRGDGPETAPMLRLVVTARTRVELDIGVQGQRTRRVLEAGERWVVNGVDHFSIRADDPDAADFELDGIVHEPPSQWSGDEWILYPPRESRPE